MKHATRYLAGHLLVFILFIPLMTMAVVSKTSNVYDFFIVVSFIIFFLYIYISIFDKPAVIHSHFLRKGLNKTSIKGFFFGTGLMYGGLVADRLNVVEEIVITMLLVSIVILTLSLAKNALVE